MPLIAVPRPLSSDKNRNISYVKALVGAMASRLKAGDIVVLESTRP